MGIQPPSLFPSFALAFLDRILLQRVQGERGADVFQVVQPLLDESPYVRRALDVRFGHAAQLREHALAARGDLGIRQHEVRVHALEHTRCGRAHVVVRQIHFFEHAAQIRESAAIVGAQHGFVADADAFEQVHHVVPTIKGEQRAVERERLRLLRRFLAIAVVRCIEVGDTVGLAQRLDEERVVGPSGTGIFAKANVMRVEERFPVDRRPDGRMVGEQMGGIADGEGLARRLDTAAVAAIELALLRRVGHPNAPVRGFHDVGRIPELRGESEHVGVHVGFDPVVRLNDGYPGAMRFIEPAVAGSAVALVGLIDDAYALVACRIGLHDGKGVVGAAIV